jgi:hypothetical protein
VGGRRTRFWRGAPAAWASAAADGPACAAWVLRSPPYRARPGSPVIECLPRSPGFLQVWSKSKSSLRKVKVNQVSEKSRSIKSWKSLGGGPGGLSFNEVIKIIQDLHDRKAVSGLLGAPPVVVPCTSAKPPKATVAKPRPSHMLPIAVCGTPVGLMKWGWAGPPPAIIIRNSCISRTAPALSSPSLVLKTWGGRSASEEGGGARQGGRHG